MQRITFCGWVPSHPQSYNNLAHQGPSCYHAGAMQRNILTYWSVRTNRYNHLVRQGPVVCPVVGAFHRTNNTAPYWWTSGGSSKKEFEETHVTPYHQHRQVLVVRTKRNWKTYLSGPSGPDRYTHMNHNIYTGPQGPVYMLNHTPRSWRTLVCIYI